MVAGWGAESGKWGGAAEMKQENSIAVRLKRLLNAVRKAARKVKGS